ncbi:uncharacterized protein EDB91DRAFT_1125355 [Suillus paluster]|uniref:uncharacterized protein n=1 Tax=Suillus paluster TaxID=48578 RepID=UPI001B874724|nr:uncharacterized protein EDB91DRAFT_1125355 [Suillus paluster]KAG1743684.1 hypothetical protein EDB91DRAFT_1125355 [Suillus paluster]
MVTITPPQPNEAEQKKRKQTLERAKANHLSKQLQMRLQYAKLKVEHGWVRYLIISRQLMWWLIA